MKFSIGQKKLETELAFVQGIVERTSTIPAISNVLIAAAGEEHIEITGTDLDTTIIASVEANITGAGEICIGAKKTLRHLDTPPPISKPIGSGF